MRMKIMLRVALTALAAGLIAASAFGQARIEELAKFRQQIEKVQQNMQNISRDAQTINQTMLKLTQAQTLDDKRAALIEAAEIHKETILKQQDTLDTIREAKVLVTRIGDDNTISDMQTLIQKEVTTMRTEMSASMKYLDQFAAMYPEQKMAKAFTDQTKRFHQQVEKILEALPSREFKSSNNQGKMVEMLDRLQFLTRVNQDRMKLQFRMLEMMAHMGKFGDVFQDVMGKVFEGMSMDQYFMEERNAIMASYNTMALMGRNMQEFWPDFSTNLENITNDMDQLAQQYIGDFEFPEIPSRLPGWIVLYDFDSKQYYLMPPPPDNTRVYFPISPHTGTGEFVRYKESDNAWYDHNPTLPEPVKILEGVDWAKEELEKAKASGQTN